MSAPPYSTLDAQSPSYSAGWNIYAKSLFPYGHGHPLWYPDPKEGADELHIGDVGYLLKGGFHVIFNTTRDANDPCQRFGIPENYQKFSISKMLEAKRKGVIEKSVCSSNVKSKSIGGDLSTANSIISGGMKFTCSSEQGAFLCIEQPADEDAFHPSKSFLTYMKANLLNWHGLATRNDLDCQPHHLIFISGVCKTNNWAVGAFTQHGHDGEVSVQANVGPFAQGSFSFALKDESSAIVHTRSKPLPEGAQPSPRPSLESGSGETIFDPSTSSASLAPKKDQSVFIHYYMMKRRLWRSKVMKAAAGNDERDPDRSGDGEDVVLNTDDIVIEEWPAREEVYNAVDILLDYILDYVMEDGSQVDMAVASDTHLYDLFPEVPLPEDIRAELYRRQPPVMFLDDDREIGHLACVEWSIEVDEDEVVDLDGTSVLNSGKQRDELQARDDYQEQSEAGPSSFQRPQEEPKDSESRTPATALETEQVPPVVLQDHTGGVACLSFSSDGRYIASGSEDTKIILRDGTTGELLCTLASHHEAVCTLAFSGDSARLASGGSDGVALVWNVAEQSVIVVLDGHTGVVQTIAYSPDGQKVVTASVDFTVRIWDALTGAQLHRLDGHNAVVMSAVFSPHGKWVASCGADYTARVWDAETGALLHDLRAHTGVVWGVAFSPNSRRLVTGSDDTTSRVWNAETGEELVELHEHHGPVWSVSFSPDEAGKHVLSASNDGTIKICDSFTGERVHTFDRHDTLVNTAVFSPNGKYVASSAGDNAVMVWETETGKAYPPMHGHLDKVTALQFSPESDRVVSCSDDGTVRIWTLPEIALVEAEATVA